MTTKHLIALALPLGAFPLAAQTLPTPLVEYKFNDATTSTTAANSGSTSTVLNLRNGSNVATQLIGADSTGVSGLATDRSLNLTAAPSMGNLSSSGGNPAGVQASDDNTVDTMTSFTLQGWFKTDSTTAIGNGARLFQSQSANDGFTLLSNTTGTLEFQVGGANGVNTLTANVTSGASYGATQSWVFFAVTYDGSVTSNNVNFYVGSTSGAVTQVGTTLSLNKGLMDNNTTALVIGNDGISSSFYRAFDGYLDNMRIWGAATGNGGVLSLAQLESVRLADTAIPEPSAFAALAGLGALGFVATRRRRQG